MNYRYELLYRMKRIRHVEETIAARYSEWKMRCPVHLCTGQEAVSAAVGLALSQSDFAVSGHRAHGHYLGKGGDLRAMLAECYGKVTGCAHGRGGSMHLIDESVGFKGSTAIVGGTIPLGVGLGLSLKLKRENAVSCIFLGDGAVEEGVFFESVNFAALKQLPVLFICENNFFSVYSPISVRQPEGRDIFEMVRGMGIRSLKGDGNNAPQIYDYTIASLERIRAGGGPEFLEFTTYRWREHCGPNFDNDLGYRSELEFTEWQAKDPIARLQQGMLSDGDLNNDDISAMERKIRSEVEEAFHWAESSAFPSPEEASSFIFAEQSP